MAEKEFFAERRKDEDRFFHERERELIAKLRAKADAERKELERKHRKQAHWMKCPKCGHDLRETKRGPLVVDECPDCKGAFFDAGELEMLLAGEKGKSLLRRIFGR